MRPSYPSRAIEANPANPLEMLIVDRPVLSPRGSHPQFPMKRSSEKSSPVDFEDPRQHVASASEFDLKRNGDQFDGTRASAN
jgi:hypothetical protein